MTSERYDPEQLDAAYEAERRRRNTDPNDRVTPEQRAEMYRTGLDRVRAILRAKGHPEHGKHYQERDEA